MELLERIIVLLAPVSAIALSHCDSVFHDVLTKPIIFKTVLKRMQLTTELNDTGTEQSIDFRMEVNMKQLRHMMAFISQNPNLKEHIPILYDVIISQFSANSWDTIKIILPHPPRPLYDPTTPHSVDTEGFLLLWNLQVPLSLHSVSVDRITGPLLAGLSSLAQTSDCPHEATVTLEAGAVVCHSDEEGEAIVRLLDHCFSWWVGHLCLYSDVGETTWTSLARMMTEWCILATSPRGRVERVYCWKKVVGRGRREDLREVWCAVERGWGVGEEWLDNHMGLELGWGRIKQIQNTPMSHTSPRQIPDMSCGM